MEIIAKQCNFVIFASVVLLYLKIKDLLKSVLHEVSAVLLGDGVQLSPDGQSSCTFVPASSPAGRGLSHVNTLVIVIKWVSEHVPLLMRFGLAKRGVRALLTPALMCELLLGGSFCSPVLKQGCLREGRSVFPSLGRVLWQPCPATPSLLDRTTFVSNSCFMNSASVF